MGLIRIISLFFIVFSLSSCSVIRDQFIFLTEDHCLAKQYMQTGEFDRAISLLNSYGSQKSKQLNSQIHYKFAKYMLEDIENHSKEVRYLRAKELLQTSIQLDAKNKEARELYSMLYLIIKKEFPETL